MDPVLVWWGGGAKGHLTHHLISQCDFCSISNVFVLNVHLEELSCLKVGETSRLGVVLREQDGSDSPNG